MPLRAHPDTIATEDSLRIAGSISRIDSTDELRGFRLYIEALLDRSSWNGLSEASLYAASRFDEGAFPLTGREVLLLDFLDGRMALLLDSHRVRRLLVLPGDFTRIRDDDLFESLQRSSLRRAPRTLHRVERTVEDPASREYLRLLLYHATIRSVRSIDQYNADVDRFVRTHPESPYARLVETHFRLRREESDWSIAMQLGYSGGAIALSDESFAQGGPSLSGRLAYRRFDVSAMIDLAQSTLTLDRRIQLIGFGADVGYNLSTENLLLRPFVGARLLYGRQDSTDGRKEAAWSTRADVGIELGTRIVFDDPPQLTLGIAARYSLFGRLSFSSPQSGWSIGPFVMLSSRSIAAGRSSVKR